MKRGFSLIELMVASLLLSMIVVLLSTMMNQSAISWRAGSASVIELGSAQQKIVNHQVEADNLLPRLYGERPLMTVSPWDVRGNVRARAFGVPQWVKSSVNRPDSDAWQVSGKGGKSGRASGCLVGVVSAGPDRKFDTEDDISSWMGDVEE